ncbi:conserved Plasmodium protein, unknown function [Plasmodium berghei]|uniref:Uncharacterized protein n=2 Tax=Plasmodium berghei TaxID=5821 RepID=A0A509AP57_PLABA|nr:conserved Plasmodium protein, unknown function [Plasmodium berghei ANKA]CXI63687.1 conserved Plasmodium protein, unknown function [Plasmodium berghei]SCM23814.1 conserved Plasmodium protein, unknown function [Plasmodium berghei]SCN26788.1 conserved Plasmodium protein, unknown function [Plasmodium berghei]SCO61132.1 conserved Plasmodium protein, unknown function [Plasmodium berghei]SCO63207.1 conserved Plasmodium protein, unknown function [Plasmodium berghei]|eukprot:XP_034422405.1 conserved Plasmodium protein, unknown function [Plasmodium berghei ANKA]
MESMELEHVWEKIVKIISPSITSLDTSDESNTSYINNRVIEKINLFDNINYELDRKINDDDNSNKLDNNINKKEYNKKNSIIYNDDNIEVSEDKTLSDIEHESIIKLIKTAMKNKNKKKDYEFRKYMSESKLFFIFVHIFLHLLKNKDKIENPYEYIINCFKINSNEISSCDEDEKKKITNENNFYKKENEELINKINNIQLDIIDIQKKMHM